MNDEIDPILVGETDDIEVGTVESFEHDDVNYAVYHLEPGFFCTQGNCNCEEKAPLSESEIEGEELECVGCGNTYSISNWRTDNITVSTNCGNHQNNKRLCLFR